MNHLRNVLSGSETIPRSRLREVCHVTSGKEGDRFVGIKITDVGPVVHFPLGYRIPVDDSSIRKDVIGLLTAIKMTNDARRIQFAGASIYTVDSPQLPLLDYITLVSDYLHTGTLLKESAVDYSRLKRGAVSWHRTFATVKPILDGLGSPVYLDLVTRTAKRLDDVIITKVHSYCLSLSFNVIGWLFTSSLPTFHPSAVPAVNWIPTIIKRLSNTFNNREQRLLRAMLNVLTKWGSDYSVTELEFGTERFEYVWERMIDSAFGSPNKEDFFPRAVWQLHTGDIHTYSSLQPDTIMNETSGLYVLDAKYYRYGHSVSPSDLPSSASVAKQIIYGSYANQVLRERGVSKPVFNAFILPGSVDHSTEASWLRSIGFARGNWIRDPNPWELVAGIVVDTAFLLRHYGSITPRERFHLSSRIAATVADQLSTAP